MLIIIAIICIAIIAVILISIIKMYKPEYAIEITICASVILLYFVVEGIGYSINYINDINMHRIKNVKPKINVNLLINNSNPLSFLS